MFVAALLAMLNAAMSFIGHRLIGFSALDLSVSLVPIAVWSGNSPFFSAVLIVFAYTFVDAREFRYLWITLPVTIFIAYLAIPIHNIYLLVLIYHGIGALAAYSLQYFSTKYWMFMLMNISANFLVARLYGAF